MAELAVVPQLPPDSIGAVCHWHGAEPRQGDRVLDTHIFIEWEGRIAICESCIREAGAAFGMLTPEKADELRQSNRALGAKLRAATVRLDAVNDLVDAARKIVNPEDEA